MRRFACVVSPLALLALFACAQQSRSMTAVEAPVVSVDASLAAIALVHDPSPSSDTSNERSGEAAPFRVGDRYVGHYNCMQGKTELVLIVEELGTHDREEEGRIPVVAIFEFHYDGANLSAGFAASDGAARMRGHFDPKTRRLVLNGEEWIDQPPNYRLVNLVGTIGKNGTYSGTVEGPGCSTFSASPEKNSGLERSSLGGTSFRQTPSLPRPRP